MHKALPIMILFLYWPPVGHTMAKVSASLTGYVKNNPDYSLLTNSIRYRSKYEYSQGNPLLKTQKTHRFSAGASWNWLYFSAYFSRILNMYTNIIMPYKEDTHPGVLLFATQTIPTTHNYGISFNASPKLGCWEPQLNVNMAFLDMNANKIGITEHRNQPLFLYQSGQQLQPSQRLVLQYGRISLHRFPARIFCNAHGKDKSMHAFSKIPFFKRDTHHNIHRQ